jgi:hypothetical protein
VILLKITNCTRKWKEHQEEKETKKLLTVWMTSMMKYWKKNEALP